MILTPHILVGAALGSQMSSPLAAFILNFIGHYILEAFPHWEYNIASLKNSGIKLSLKSLTILAKVAIDFSIGAGLVFWLIGEKTLSPTILAGIFGALLPDGLLFLYWRFPSSKILKFFHTPHRAMHIFKNKSPVWLDSAVEIVVIILAAGFLFFIQ